MPGQSFEFTPAGIIPLDIGPTQALGGGQPKRNPPSAQDVAVVARGPVVADRARTTKDTAPVPQNGSPGAVVKAAKARAKEIRVDLKRMRGLQKELAELERLLKAAREKPAKVQPLRRAV
jgi:hypothetical protein